jgi:hypothetical protein
MQSLFGFFILLVVCANYCASFQLHFPIQRCKYPSKNSNSHFNFKALTYSTQSVPTEANGGVEKFLDVASQRDVSIGAGVAGLLIILFNRLFLTDFDYQQVEQMANNIGTVSDIQSRADLLGMMASCALLLNALSEQDIATKAREKIPLMGYTLTTPYINPIIPHSTQLSWLMTSLLSVSSSLSSVHVIDYESTLLAAYGVCHLSFQQQIPLTISTSTSPILRQAYDENREIYLPDLQILPGKIEFSYLPINAQSVLIVPLSNKQGSVIVATNQAKSLTFLEVKKIRAIIDIYSSSF